MKKTIWFAIFLFAILISGFFFLDQKYNLFNEDKPLTGLVISEINTNMPNFSFVWLIIIIAAIITYIYNTNNFGPA